MPKVSAEHRQARRDQIARAAITQFAQHGIHSTSMTSIIETAGLSAGAIYTHFASKDEIIAYVAHATVDGVLAGVEGVLDTDPLPSPGHLLGLIATTIPRTDIPPGLILQVWAEAITNPALRQTANQVYARVLDHLREYFTLWLTAHDGLDLRLARRQAPRRARVFLSLVYSHILQAALIDTHDAEVFTNDLAELLDATG